MNATQDASNRLNTPTRLATEEETAASLAISVRHLQRLRARQLIPFVRLGRIVRYEQGAVEAAIFALTVQPRK